MRGFTLIELAIVLVIIGLIVGGVLVGRDLISAAAMRAQISQIEKIQQAIGTFRSKYSYLPGDIKDPEASSFGFQSRGALLGQGDGDGTITGFSSGTRSHCYPASGEAALAWADLSQISLIDGSFTATTATSQPSPASNSAVAAYLPVSKISDGAYLMLDNDRYFTDTYLSLVTVNSITTGRVATYSNPLTVGQANAIDSKIDDGLPGSGNTLAGWPTVIALGAYWRWANSTGAVTTITLSTSAIAGTSTTCYDNGSVAGIAQTYSVAQGGTGKNCALSFRLKGF